MQVSTHNTQHANTASVSVRPVSPEDERRLRAMFSRLSRQSIYLRFHAPLPSVPEWAVAAFADADREDGESLVAVSGAEIVGHAMYVRTIREAEFAVVVEDRWQGRGVGKRLLSEVVARATDRGVGVLTGAVLGENRRMLGLVGSVFDEVSYAVEDGAYVVRAPVLRSDTARESTHESNHLGLSA